MKKTIFQQIIFALSILTMFLFATSSCNEPSLIGGDVIDTDRPDVVFTDTLSIFATSVKDDSIQTYDVGSASSTFLSTYLCGYLEDPIFGKSTSVINSQLRLTGALDPETLTRIADGTLELDSAFFVLEYDTAGIFGSLNTVQDLSIYLLDEDMDNIADYYSNNTFQATQLLTTETINPFVYDSTFLVVSSNGDSIRPPQLKIKLDENHPLFTDHLWGNNTDVYDNDTTLLESVKGIQIRVDNPPTENSTMMAFDLSSAIGGLYLYYNPDTAAQIYRLRVNGAAAQMVSFDHDFSTGIIEEYINNEEKGDSLFFVQGMIGLNGKLRIPYTDDLKNAIINKATLELTIASSLPADDPNLYNDPIEQLILSKKDEDGELVTIADFSSAFGGSLVGLFGGNLVREQDGVTVVRTYTMNISQHLQDMINGVETSDEIFITAFGKAQTAQRSIIFGPGHPTHPVKINVTYTINQ